MALLKLNTLTYELEVIWHRRENKVSYVSSKRRKDFIDGNGIWKE